MSFLQSRKWGSRNQVRRPKRATWTGYR